MNRFLAKQQTVLIQCAKLEFTVNANRSLLTISIGGLVHFVKFNSSGDVVSVTIASKGVEVDIGT